MSILADEILARFGPKYTILETLDGTQFITTVITPTGIIIEERNDLTKNFAVHLGMSVASLVEKIEITNQYEEAVAAKHRAETQLKRIIENTQFSRAIENVEVQRG